MTQTELLDRLSALAGLQTRYTDAFGTERAVPDDARRRLLAAMGYRSDSEGALAHAVRAIEHTAQTALLPPVVIARDDTAMVHVPLHLPPKAHGRLRWEIALEDGSRRTGRAGLDGKIAFPAPLPRGYHDLRITWTRGETIQNGHAVLIVAPARCYQPPNLAAGARRWGLSAQLYAVRSPRNWGIGDFTDLMLIVRHAARLRAACVGLNPLHALFGADPEAVSPYAPNSRLFLNTLYIDIEAVPDYLGHRRVAVLVGSPAFQDRLAAMRTAETVDYAGVAAAKQSVLRLLYAAFRANCLADENTPRAKAFRAFQQERGEALRRFALFEALQAAGGEYRAALRDGNEAAIAAFAQAHVAEIEYFEYLQWEAARQLGLAQDAAKRLGMTIGLYTDLAVGTSGGGAEAWSNRECLIDGAHVGAPPDLLNLKGQDWGLPPLHPARLRAVGYAPFRALLEANMRASGALRIDHILGFMRLFWIPAGASPRDGAYVRYPWDELLAVLALESHRHCCLVIGEDLGTVPEGFSEALHAAGIFSTRVFYFEKTPDGAFRAPQDYPADALVTVSTHDLPTFAAYWTGADLDLRTRLGLWTSDSQEGEQRAARTAEKAAAVGLFRAIAPTAADDEIPIQAVTEVIAATPAKLIMVQLEDVAGQIAQMNVPGTWNEYPNWRIRLKPEIETLLTGARMAALARGLAVTRSDLPTALGAAPVVATAAAAPPNIPIATYRLQFNAGFTFDDAAHLVPYLKALGISHLYASPWLKARPGSSHGYDVVDHTAFNPELGGAAAFDNLSTVLGAYGIGHILDFVPNHMGIGGSMNGWWIDVLESGRASGQAAYFDIEWNPGTGNLRNKLLLPVLGQHYGEVLEAGALVPRFDPSTGTFAVWYHEHKLPIAPADYAALIARALLFCADDPAAQNTLRGLSEAFAETMREPRRPSARTAAVRELQVRLAETAETYPAAHAALSRALADLATGGEQARVAPLHDLLEQQHYRLAHWAAAADEINYRRFFNINELAAVRMENPWLFGRAHKLVEQLLAEGRLHGLRIDHVDGLYDPAGYCTALQRLAAKARGADAPPLYILVEKILARHERLRDWPVSGTTGYEAIAQIGGLFVAADNENAMTRTYHRFIGGPIDFDAVAADTKALVMDTMFRSELRVLSRRLHRVAQQHWHSRDYTELGLRHALRAIAAEFPVYRTYVGDEITAEDRRDIDWAVARAVKNWRAPGREIIGFVGSVITADLARADSGYPAGAVVRFARKFQQFTAPITAKSIEDTAFYRFHRLAALNEVGSDPRQFGISLAAFHAQNRERARLTPHAMITTATHDTKRGEDTRARLYALSELPQEWARAVRRWQALNARHKIPVDDRPAPDANDEYLIYQTLAGAWPMALLEGDDAAAMSAFKARLTAYLVKVLREAKVHASWDYPNPAYEDATLAFVERLLDPRFGRAFLTRFRPFVRRIAHLGMLNGLVQVALKLTIPGVPDFYQGTELWDLSLVDPDNRRPVDYAQRLALLPALAATDVDAALNDWPDGRIKFLITRRLLALRQAEAALFRDGDYEPLPVRGSAAEHVCAFARRHDGRAVVVMAGRHFAALTAAGERLPSAQAWDDTAASLSGFRGRDVLTGRPAADTIGAAEAFARLPVAVFVGDTMT